MLLLKFNSLAHLHILSKEEYKVEGDKKRNTSNVLTTISVFNAIWGNLQKWQGLFCFLNSISIVCDKVVTVTDCIQNAVSLGAAEIAF